MLYEPDELVLQCRAGTPLAEVEALLAEQGQILAFEPPAFGESATIGGTVACGFSGPRRPWGGALRDHLLGVRIVNGRGQSLKFGGRVMKNVAGYDVSRLMAGAMGTLGVLLDVSLKVLPRPVEERTFCGDCVAEEAIRRMNDWSGRPLPLSGQAWVDGRLFVRLSGAAGEIADAGRFLEGLDPADSGTFWEDLREHRLGFFGGPGGLWRISVQPGSAPLPLEGETLMDWGGALRWLKSDQPVDDVRAAASASGGHATLFRAGPGLPPDAGGGVFHPLPPGLRGLHDRIRKAFDPQGIFNPGRMYGA